MIAITRINGWARPYIRRTGRFQSPGVQVQPGRTVFSWDTAPMRWRGVEFSIGKRRVFIGRRVP